MPMDAARRSALAGAVVGGGVAVMGAVIVAIAARYIRIPDSDIHVPRLVLGLLGAGCCLCGLAFAFSMLGPRATAVLAVPGIALAFVVPAAWIAFGPGLRECGSSLGIGFFTVSGLQGGAATCRAAFAVGAVLALGIVIAAAGHLVRQWGPPAWGERLEKAGGGIVAAPLAVVLLAGLLIASPVLLLRRAARGAYALFKGGSAGSGT